MAHVVPSDFMSADYSEQHRGEIETLRRLQRQLPNDYTVYHSLHWSNERERFTTFGEIDFVIVNRSGRILMVEQKNGELLETSGGLFKLYGQERKNVADQVARNHENIRKKLKRCLEKGERPEVDYLVYLPDYLVVNVNAAGLEASRIVDQSSMGTLAERIDQMLGPGTDRDADYAARVRGFFNQQFEVVPAVSSYVATQQATYTRMREGLADVIENLDFEPFRLRVEGSAGCGKSQLTLRFRDRWMAEGKRVLLLCFNHELGRSLQRASGTDENVGTFHDFCRRQAEMAGQPLDFSRAGTAGFWDEVLDRVIDLEIPEEERFDGLIVDEGQDFEQGWFERLELFLKPDASILWLEDQDQNLQRKRQVCLDGFVTYRERSNFRSPSSIAAFVQRSLGVDFRPRNPLPGLGVAVHQYAAPEAMLKLAAVRAQELVRMGFAPEEVVLVSCTGLKGSALLDPERDRLGAFTLRRFTGEYDENGRQVLSDGQLFCDTVFRFKGRQAPAVIVTDVHPGLREDDWARRVLYCAMTRATVRLELLVSEDSAWREPLVAAQDR